MTASVSYEEKRKQRMEENKRRMQELNLHHLYQSLKPKPKPKPSFNHTIKPSKPVKDGPTGPPRRSTRMADKTPPNYKHKRISVKAFAKGQREYTVVRSNKVYRVSISDEDRVYTANKAKQLALCLDSKFPTFVKLITLGPLFGGCIRLPETFCKNHLPNNEVLTAVDEDKQEWQLSYRVRYGEFVGGWRKFSSGQQLVDGDALVFQLIRPNTLKVYIIRVNKVMSCF